MTYVLDFQFAVTMGLYLPLHFLCHSLKTHLICLLLLSHYGLQLLCVPAGCRKIIFACWLCLPAAADISMDQETHSGNQHHEVKRTFHPWELVNKVYTDWTLQFIWCAWFMYFYYPTVGWCTKQEFTSQRISYYSNLTVSFHSWVKVGPQFCYSWKIWDQVALDTCLNSVVITTSGCFSIWTWMNKNVSLSLQCISSSFFFYARKHL